MKNERSPLLIQTSDPLSSLPSSSDTTSSCTIRHTLLYLALSTLSLVFLLFASSSSKSNTPSKLSTTTSHEPLLSQAAPSLPTNDLIRPGSIWIDNNGTPIDAHGGCILYYSNTYYWYGEMKSHRRTYLPACNAAWGGTRVDFVGISCYSSKDLVHWEFRGNVLPAVTNNATHDLYIGRVIERPKVVLNEATGRFVMWMHVDGVDYGEARCGVAVADRPDGPFAYRGSFRPNVGSWPISTAANTTLEEKQRTMPLVYRDYRSGQMSRDLTVFVDDDAKAYLFYSSENNPTIHVSLLTDDYLTTTSIYSRIFINRYTEAPTVFKRNGKYHFIGSGCTAWLPNAARAAVSDSVWGPWVETGNPCVGQEKETTFRSQSTFVLPLTGISREKEGKGNGGYLFMADRWNANNLSDSRYAWLPIAFDEKGNPIIRWHDEWSPAVELG